VPHLKERKKKKPQRDKETLREKIARDHYQNVLFSHLRRDGQISPCGLRRILGYQITIPKTIYFKTWKASRLFNLCCKYLILLQNLKNINGNKK
jgi:hypothetical protein